MGGLRDEIASCLATARARTLGLCAPLCEADLAQAHAGCLGPMLWDLGHIGAFEELWIVHKAGGQPLEHPGRLDMYDPFEVPREDREEQPLPDLAATLSYLERVRHRALTVLEQLPEETDDPLLCGGFVFRMAVQHEWQHQEIVLQGLDLRSSDEPYPPAVPLPEKADRSAGSVDDTQVVEIPAGPIVIGATDPTSTYDNERPAHRMSLPGFRVDCYPVTCRRWLEFVEDGGYQRPELWSPAGRAWLEANSPHAPQGWWQDRLHRWWVTRFGFSRPLPLDEPVQHVCAHEAEAFATWAGGRLPTEFEWERLAAGGAPLASPPRYPWGDEAPTPKHGNLFGDRWGPAPIGAHPEGASAEGVHQLLGDVYEWTSSPLRAYPGFEAFPYREYSEVFFGDEYRVLRGASWASGPWMARRSYRNWDFPIRRQLFAGLRLVWDLD